LANAVLRPVVVAVGWISGLGRPNKVRKAGSTISFPFRPPRKVGTAEFEISVVIKD